MKCVWFPGKTPLHIAAEEDSYAVAKLLLDSGAKANMINSCGKMSLNNLNMNKVLILYISHIFMGYLGIVGKSVRF